MSFKVQGLYHMVHVSKFEIKLSYRIDTRAVQQEGVHWKNDWQRSHFTRHGLQFLDLSHVFRQRLFFRDELLCSSVRLRREEIAVRRIHLRVSETKETEIKKSKRSIDRSVITHISDRCGYGAQNW